jgi:hypothetical protein
MFDEHASYYNIAINSHGDKVSWLSSSEQYTFAVHVLLHPDMKKPSRCFYFNDAQEALQCKDELTARYYKDIQRAEVCKVTHEPAKNNNAKTSPWLNLVASALFI